MVNFEKPIGGERNDNFEWAILKEMAEKENADLDHTREYLRNEVTREKMRQRGKKIMEIIGRMPDKLSVAEKAEKLDKIHATAERIGIAEDLRVSLDARRGGTFESGMDRGVLDDSLELSEVEQEKVEKLREKVVDLTNIEPGALAEEFPSGKYLYHGSTVSRLAEILQAGELKNGVALMEDNFGEGALGLNSGAEGISWSMNGIDALPGTRGHIAGFLAAPEDLAGDTRFVIPSRPAPYEVLQMSKNVDPKEFYATKKQLETWGEGGIMLAEKNNVEGNLKWMLIHEEGGESFDKPMVYKYQGNLSQEELQKYYTLDENNNVVWDEDLYQKFDVPPALPWMQSLIDRDIFAKNGYEGLDTVRDVLAYAQGNTDFIRVLLATEQAAAQPVSERFEKLWNDVEALRIDVDKMYFVTSHQDLAHWLKIMAKTGAEPKGILLYDDNQVVMENFASQFEGNHRELSREIGEAIGVDGSFWQNEMGMDVENMPRSGQMGQVLLESAVKHDKVLEFDKNGALYVTTV